MAFGNPGVEVSSGEGFMKSVARRFGAVAVLAVVFVAGYALAAQPHMEAALHALENARDELKAAEADKGGHRAKAIDLVETAVAPARISHRPAPRAHRRRALAARSGTAAGGRPAARQRGILRLDRAHY